MSHDVGMTSSFLSGGIIFSAEALKTVKIDQKLIATIKGTLKWENSDQKCKKVKISKNMPVKIQLRWKRQIAWTKTCYTKLLSDKF